MIVHLVSFNKQHKAKRASFLLRVAEDLAILIAVHRMGSPLGVLSLPPELLCYFDDPFWRALETLRLAASPGESLLACHVDLKNAF